MEIVRFLRVWPGHVLELFNQEPDLGYEDLVELFALMVAWR